MRCLPALTLGLVSPAFDFPGFVSASIPCDALAPEGVVDLGGERGETLSADGADRNFLHFTPPQRYCHYRQRSGIRSRISQRGRSCTRWPHRVFQTSNSLQPSHCSISHFCLDSRLYTSHTSFIDRSGLIPSIREDRTLSNVQSLQVEQFSPPLFRYS